MNEFEQFKATYFQECADLLGETEENLALLDQGARDGDILHAIFRAVHSIKGGAGAFGFDDLVAFTHSFETLLDLLRENKIEATADVVALCVRGADIVSDLVAAARSGTPVPPDHGADVKRRIEEISGGGDESVIESFDDIDFTPVRFDDAAESAEPPAFDAVMASLVPDAPEGTVWTIDFAPYRALYERANDPLLLIRELSGLGATTVTARVAATPPLADVDPLAPILSWTIRLVTTAPKGEIESVFEFVEGDCALSIREGEPGESEPAATAAAPAETSFADLMASLAPVAAAAEPAPSFADFAAELGVGAAAPKAEPAAAPRPATPSAEAPASAPAAKVEQVGSIRVDLDKIDRVVDMVGELVITQAMLTQQIDDHLRERYPDIVRGLEVLAQHTRSLQDSVMSIRAQPVKSVFSRMGRLVRDLSAQVGKKVRLEMTGEGTEIDKTVIEQLADPLTHMIRNSLDHGLETPEKRLAAGKAEEGVIRLSAEQAGGRIVIQVSDDGAGINRARVLAKAMEKGIVPQGAQLSDEEIDQLVFAPGFSTAEAVTNLSGRGVGMDVVRQNIQKLGGRVTVRNAPGRGATMVLTLPLTLAVLDVMLVKVGNTPMVIPLASIVESMTREGAAIGHLPSGAKVIKARGAYVPLLHLADLLAVDRPGDQAERDGFLILCEADGAQRVALAVDAIHGQQQVVIKSIEANFDRIEGVAGATILGDGSVALILDIVGLKRVAERRAPARAA
jgi:two-component system chemotaxis sensor kinase CheA